MSHIQSLDFFFFRYNILKLLNLGHVQPLFSKHSDSRFSILYLLLLIIEMGLLDYRDLLIHFHCIYHPSILMQVNKAVRKAAISQSKHKIPGCWFKSVKEHWVQRKDREVQTSYWTAKFNSTDKFVSVVQLQQNDPKDPAGLQPVSLFTFRGEVEENAPFPLALYFL